MDDPVFRWAVWIAAVENPAQEFLSFILDTSVFSSVEKLR